MRPLYCVGARWTHSLAEPARNSIYRFRTNVYVSLFVILRVASHNDNHPWVLLPFGDSWSELGGSPLRRKATCERSASLNRRGEFPVTGPFEVVWLDSGRIVGFTGQSLPGLLVG